MKKRLICLALALAVLFSLCACGDGGKYTVAKKITTQSYSIGFRSGDSTYHYIDKALKELSSSGKIDELAQKWFGNENAVSFPKGKNAMKDLGYIPPRDFIIGVDLDSFPMCMQNGEEYDGFDIELARAVCEKLGWALKIQPIHSENAFVELNSGNIDCAWGGVVLDRESPDYTILVTYMTNELALVCRGDQSKSLRDKTLYMGASQYYLDIMTEAARVSNKLGQISRLQGGTPDYFAALDNGDCDFILTTDSAVYYYNTH